VIFQLSDWNLHGFYAKLLLLLLLFSLMRKRSFGIIKICIIEEKKAKKYETKIEIYTKYNHNNERYI